MAMRRKKPEKGWQYNLGHGETEGGPGGPTDEKPDSGAGRARVSEVPPPAVHRYSGHHQERRDSRPAVRGSTRRKDHVRRLLDRGIRPDRGIGHAPEAGSQHV